MSQGSAEAKQFRPLIERLKPGQALESLGSLRLVFQLAKQVESLRKKGESHLSINMRSVYADEQFRPRLALLTGLRRFGGDSSNPELCPLELAGQATLELPVQQEKADAILRNHGSTLSSLHIDVYQMGTLLCRLLTGKSIAAYADQAALASAIPDAIRPVLERMVGYGIDLRFQDCESLITELKRAFDLETVRKRSSSDRSQSPSKAAVDAPTDSDAPRLVGVIPVEPDYGDPLYSFTEVEEAVAEPPMRPQPVRRKLSDTRSSPDSAKTNPWSSPWVVPASIAAGVGMAGVMFLIFWTFYLDHSPSASPQQSPIAANAPENPYSPTPPSAAFPAGPSTPRPPSAKLPGVVNVPVEPETPVPAVKRKRAPVVPGKTELHVVGFYEGANFRIGDRPSVTGAEITVDRPGALVVLCVTAYHRMTWNIKVEEGSKVVKVIVGGHERQTVTGLTNEVEMVEAHHGSNSGRRISYAYSRDSTELKQLIADLREMTDLDVASFHGNYRFNPKEPVIIDDIDNDLPKISLTPTPLAELPKLQFKAVSTKFGPGSREPQVSYGDFSLEGPVPDSLQPVPNRIVCLAQDPASKTFYGLSAHELFKVDLDQQSATQIARGANVSDMSWPRTLAFDSKRGRVLVGTCHVGSRLYAYVPATDTWSFIAQLPGDAAAIGYHPGLDRIFLAGRSGGGEKSLPAFYHLSEKGAVIKQISLSPPLPPNLPGRETRVQLIAADKYMVLLVGDSGYDPSSSRQGAAQFVSFLIDPETDEVVLTQRQVASNAGQLRRPATSRLGKRARTPPAAGQSQGPPPSQPSTSAPLPKTREFDPPLTDSERLTLRRPWVSVYGTPSLQPHDGYMVGIAPNNEEVAIVTPWRDLVVFNYRKQAKVFEWSGLSQFELGPDWNSMILRGNYRAGLWGEGAGTDAANPLASKLAGKANYGQPRPSLLLGDGNAMAFSPDGKSIWTSYKLGPQGGDKIPLIYALFDIEKRRVRFEMKGNLLLPAFTADSRTIALTREIDFEDARASIELLDAQTASLRLKIPFKEADLGNVYAMAFSPKGDCLVVFGRKAKQDTNPPVRAAAFSLPDGKLRWHYDWPDIHFGSLAAPYETRIVFSGDNRHVLVHWGGSIAQANVLTVDQGELQFETKRFLASAFSPDGKLLALGGEGKTVLLLPTDTWAVGNGVPSVLEKCMGLCFSRNSDELAVLGAGGLAASAVIYKVKSREVVYKIDLKER